MKVGLTEYLGPHTPDPTKKHKVNVYMYPDNNHINNKDEVEESVLVNPTPHEMHKLIWDAHHRKLKVCIFDFEDVPCYLEGWIDEKHMRPELGPGIDKKPAIKKKS